MKPISAFSLALIITFLVAFNFHFLKEKQNTRSVLVERVIDGDTLVTSEGETIRLLNINTPEKSERGYEEAKSFLSKFEGKSLEAEIKGSDKYGRTLARLYSDSIYINLEIVTKGLGKKFLVDKSELKDFNEAESRAIENSLGNWQHSGNYRCFNSEINQESELISLKNSCSGINFKDWTMADESRKKYKFKSLSFDSVNIHTESGTDNSTDLYWNSNQAVWNNDRDTLYLFDAERKVAHFHSYGYSFLAVFSPLFRA